MDAIYTAWQLMEKTSRETECIRLPCQAVYRDGEGSAREVYIV